MAAIILNGTSSSGKTSIAKAIQILATEPFIHLSVDSFLEMFHWDTLSNKQLQDDCMKAAVLGFHRTLPVMLAGKFPGIIDHVIYGNPMYEDLTANLRAHFTLLVGVHCPLEILRDRESSRGNRSIGIAESQFQIVHHDRKYDVEVDTSVLSPEACASKILSAYYQKKSDQNAG